MIDSERPRVQPHNRKNQGRASRPRYLADIEARFVYAGELKGTWFRVNEAVTRNLPILPNPEYAVIRMEFRDRSEL